MILLTQFLSHQVQTVSKLCRQSQRAGVNIIYKFQITEMHLLRAIPLRFISRVMHNWMPMGEAAKSHHSALSIWRRIRIHFLLLKRMDMILQDGVQT